MPGLLCLLQSKELEVPHAKAANPVKAGVFVLQKRGHVPRGFALHAPERSMLLDLSSPLLEIDPVIVLFGKTTDDFHHTVFSNLERLDKLQPTLEASEESLVHKDRGDGETPVNARLPMRTLYTTSIMRMLYTTSLMRMLYTNSLMRKLQDITNEDAVYDIANKDAVYDIANEDTVQDICKKDAAAKKPSTLENDGGSGWSE
ncbi:uncharacterized protein [Symphalangus syndactylus]|uniref:uncharacterized protein isoform X2 n=2 Tax=Symphalangus syndactylus TaxID=9590 RepID=UPI003006AD66